MFGYAGSYVQYSIYIFTYLYYLYNIYIYIALLLFSVCCATLP